MEVQHQPAIAVQRVFQWTISARLQSTLNSSDRSVIQRLQFKPAHWLVSNQGPQCLAPMGQMDPEMTLR
jgi:hypothetical protein